MNCSNSWRCAGSAEPFFWLLLPFLNVLSVFVACHLLGPAWRKNIPGSPAGAAQTFLSSLTNVRREELRGCGPLCDSPSIARLLSPTISAYCEGSNLLQDALFKKTKKKKRNKQSHLLYHTLLILNRKDLRVQSCQEEEATGARGGFYKLALLRRAWGRQQTEKWFGVADETLQPTCDLKK